MFVEFKQHASKGRTGWEELSTKLLNIWTKWKYYISKIVEAEKVVPRKKLLVV